MKKVGSKQIISLSMLGIGIVFMYIGIFQLGFWNKEPKSGFFPSIIAGVMILGSIASLFQTLKEEVKVEYNLLEIKVIMGALLIIAGTFVLGLLPSIFLYLFIWLKFVEKARWMEIITIMIIMAAIVFGVFVVWLQVQFPLGLFEWIL